MVDTLEQKSVNYRIHTYLCLIMFYDKVCLFHVKIIGLSSLESLLPFWIPSLPPCFPRVNPTSLPPPPHGQVCCLSMPPRKRESLESVKERLVTEQKARTERRVRQLLQQTQRYQTTVKKTIGLLQGITRIVEEGVTRQPTQIVRLLGRSVVVCSLVSLRLFVCCLLYY